MDAAHVAHVIGGLGSPHFADHLLEGLAAVVPVDHVSLVRLERGSRVRLLASATRPGRRVAGEVQTAYLSRFHRLDPNRQALPGTTAQPSVRRLRRDEVADPAYRYHCFDRPDLVDRLSVLVVHGAAACSLNLYRLARSGGFAEAEAAAIGAWGAVLSTLAIKHGEMVFGTGRPGAPRSLAASRLAALGAGLSGQEIAVGAAIVAGMTSEAVALDLGIATNSVLTYRKRLYAKLGISSQGELFALCLAGRHIIV